MFLLLPLPHSPLGHRRAFHAATDVLGFPLRCIRGTFHATTGVLGFPLRCTRGTFPVATAWHRRDLSCRYHMTLEGPFLSLPHDIGGTFPVATEMLFLQECYLFRDMEQGLPTFGGKQQDQVSIKRRVSYPTRVQKDQGGNQEGRRDPKVWDREHCVWSYVFPRI